MLLWITSLMKPALCGADGGTVSSVRSSGGATRLTDSDRQTAGNEPVIFLICFHSPAARLSPCPSVSVAITHFPFVCCSDRQMFGPSHTLSPSLITCLCLARSRLYSLPSSSVLSLPLRLVFFLVASVYLFQMSLILELHAHELKESS